MSMLEVREVSKVYKTGTFGGDLLPALRHVSFDIDQGQVVSLIGQSGSGKSTLGKIILRLTSPSAGAVVFEGKDVGTWSKSQLRDYYRHVQGVFQDPFSSYNPLYKADRVLEMVRSVYFPDVRAREWESKLRSALEAVSLNPADVLNKFPHQLSGGQQQRLLIARALLLEVRLLIADEIISMLDASTRVDVLNLLVDLKRKGLGVLFITHDLSLGNYISDRTVILRKGVIVEMGDTRKVFGNAQHPYTKSLLTAVPHLHQKWQSNGSGARAHSVVEGERPTDLEGPVGGSVALGESRRYSKSPLHPQNAAASEASGAQGPRAGGARPSLMEGGGPRWNRRFSPGGRTVAEVLAAAPAPELVEYEPDHFVAVGY